MFDHKKNIVITESSSAPENVAVTFRNSRNSHNSRFKKRFITKIYLPLILVVAFFSVVSLSTFLFHGAISQVTSSAPNAPTGISPVILISEAFLLDQHGNVLQDIYHQVQARDNNYVTAHNGQYVRIVFEKPLNSRNDITMVAKSDSGAVVNVYSGRDGQLIATFNNIAAESVYKVSLANLALPSDTFDLRITGDIDIDYITDPPAWTETQPAGDVDKSWGTAASSASGARLIVGESAGRLYLSSNYGSSWSETQPAGNVDRDWASTAMSADGQYLAVGVGNVSNGRLYISSNYGSSWSETRPAGDTNKWWRALAMSSDGQRLIAGARNSGRLYISDDYGSTWTETQPAGDVDASWMTAASSADGSRLVAAIENGRIYLSSNYGASWTETQPRGDVDRYWHYTLSSADGSRLAVVVNNGDPGGPSLHTSNDYGATWTERLSGNWYAFAGSSDGLQLIAGDQALTQRIYVSSDQGANFTETQPGGDVNLDWYTAASNASGSRFLAGVNGGRLYTSIRASYWVGGTGNWSDAANHWASSSGGTAGAANLPDASTNVYFDSSSGTGTVTVDSNVSVAGFSSTSSNITVSAGSRTMNIGGDWSNSGGVFTAGTSTVNLNGTMQTISGTTTFYNVTKSVSVTDTLTWTAGTTQTIAASGTLTLTGASGELLFLRSSSSGTQWSTTVNGSSSVNYVDVKDSNASGGSAITANNSVNSLNNLNWNFGNSAPSFSGNPSDGGSSSSALTNVGSNIAFTATATDPESDNYYVAFCKTNSITANNNAAPTCNGGNWCISSSTASASQASCNYTALLADSSSNAWYAFVCDHDASSTCSSSSQGSIGNNGSPFVINHRPVFTSMAATAGNITPGNNAVFTTVATDSDSSWPDTMTLYVCKANDFTGTACGSGGMWCQSSAASSNPTCNYAVQSSDTSGSYDYYGFIIDNHNFAASANPKSGTISFRVVSSGGGGGGGGGGCTGFSCSVNSCGDGNRAGTEQCDDGNTAGGDGCSTGCTVEQGWQCSPAASGGSGSSGSSGSTGGSGSGTCNSVTSYAVPTNSYPYDITTGADDNMWFVEWASNKIGRITPLGSISEFTIPSSGATGGAPSSWPTFITNGSDGNLWFTENRTGKIARITPAGVITEFPYTNGYFGAIGFGPDGNVWFTDYVYNKIVKMTPSGVMTGYSVTVNPDPNTSSLNGIVAGSDGNMWFVESNSNKIGRITMGGVVTEFAIPTANSLPMRIVAGPDGNLWFTEQRTNKIGKITPSGVITEFSLPQNNAFGYGPTYLTTGADGNIWYIAWAGDKMGRITPAGVVDEYAIPNGTLYGLALGSDGNLWYVNGPGNTVHKFNPCSSGGSGGSGGSSSSSTADVCSSVCGDNLVVGSEQCDDGNTVSGDGCSSTCRADSSVCSADADCGTDGFVSSPFCQGNDPYQNYTSYTCNNPGAANATCTSSTVAQQQQTCSATVTTNCVNVTCSAGQHNVCNAQRQCVAVNGPGSDQCQSSSDCVNLCGNGMRNLGEQCDDGNTVSGDGCSSLCKIEFGWQCLPEPPPPSQAYRGMSAIQLAATADNSIWTFGSYLSPTTVIRSSGSQEQIDFYPFGMAGGVDGNLWFGGMQDPGSVDTVARMNPATFAPTYFNGPGFYSSFDPPITPGPDGNMWFVSGAAPSDPRPDLIRVNRVTPAGVVTGQFTHPDLLTYVDATAPNTPAIPFITASSDYVWVGAGRNIFQVDPVTGTITKFPVTAIFGNIAFMTADQNNNVWFVTYNNSGYKTINKITLGGAVTTWPSTPLEYLMGTDTEGRTNPLVYGEIRDVVFGPDGNLWVIGTGQGMWRVTEVGGQLSILVYDQFNGYHNVIGADGNLWISTGNEVIKFILSSSSSSSGGGAGGSGSSGDICTYTDQHNICQNQQCIVVSGQGTDRCQIDSDCVAPTHTECQNQQCIPISGAGVNQCASDSECTTFQSHTICNSQQQCISVNGPGFDQCQAASDCLSTHTQCQNNQCVPVPGVGINQCQGNGDCLIQKHNECNAKQQCIVVDGVGFNQCQSSNDCVRPVTHTQCSSDQCVAVNGPGVNQCGNNGDCLACFAPK